MKCNISPIIVSMTSERARKSTWFAKIFKYLTFRSFDLSTITSYKKHIALTLFIKIFWS